MTREPIHRLRWTAEDMQRLRELAAAGTSTRAIARKLKRTIRAVRLRAKSERIALTDSKGE